MAVLCIKLTDTIKYPTHTERLDAGRAAVELNNIRGHLEANSGPEIERLTDYEVRHIDEESVYYVFGVVPTGESVKIQTLLDLGRRAAQCFCVHAAMAFTHPDQIRGSDLKDMGGFSALMDMVDAETELFNSLQ